MPSSGFQPGAHARESGRLGGKMSAEARRLRAAADPLTRGLLGHLLTYRTADWMDRLGLTESSWDAWRVIGKVLDGVPLSAVEQESYRRLTGRTTLPTELRELWTLAGRGSGKSTFMAVLAIRAACRSYAVRGIPRVLLLAFVKEQAGIAFEYVRQFMDGDRELRKLLTRQTRDALELAHGTRIQTIASQYRQVRGYSVASALLDEVAHWWNETTNANPDVEIIRALRPGLGKVAGSRLLAATTPWTQEGLVFDIHERHYANEASQHILVVKAPTLLLNPSFDAARIAADEAEDPESAAAEYHVAWRVAGGTLVRPAVLDAAVAAGVVERAPEAPLGDDAYAGAVDLSGGTGEDSAAFTVFHVDEDEEGKADRAVQDVLREWEPPFDPGAVVAEIARECARFGITEVVGDQFSAGFAASEFRRHGIAYVVSARKTPECLLDALAVLNTKRALLLADPKARRQWLNLRRDYASGGRPTIVETRRHDDLAVVTARGIVAALGLGEEPKPSLPKFMIARR